MSGGGGNTTTVQKADPWSGQQPALRQLYNDAQGLKQQQYFPDSTVVPQSPETLQALNQQTTQANKGLASNLWGNTVQGDYLYGNPGFNAALNAANNQIAPLVQGQFEAGGRYGSGLAQEAQTSALGDVFAGMYGQERNRQQMAMMNPQIGYSDISALSNVGAQREDFQRELLADQLNRWNFAQQAPYSRLSQQSAIIKGGINPGGTTTGTQPFYRNRTMGALGGAASGAALGGALGGAASGAAAGSVVPIWGTAAGALIGGLAGAFA